MKGGEIFKAIETACRQHKVCKVKLSDEPRSRIIHPFGISVMSGNKLAIVCYQVNGFSSTGSLPQYRNLSLDECEQVQVLEDTFEVHADFNPEGHQYREWLFHI